MRITLFNVKYSPNLGDGLLSECLERELSMALPGIVAQSCDLAGRVRYGDGGSLRGRALTVLEALPGRVRRIVARIILSQLVGHRLRPRYGRALQSTDAVVIGGGNLFADADLNFPMKIGGALAEAACRDLPVFVFGVGVSDNWSPIGRRMFRAGLTRVRLIDVTVRDERSQTLWHRLLGSDGTRSAGLAYDPGLLASHHYPRAPVSVSGRRVGLCITDPLALRYHADRGTAFGDIGRWYRDVIAALAQAGCTIELFTNGSPEDRAYLAANASALCAAGGGLVSIEAGFADPAGLAYFLSGCDLVIAHRMHACIAAHSFGVPTIGLAWDVKLDSFFAIAGRSAYMIDPAKVPALALAAIASRALNEGVDRVALDALIAQSRADVATLARNITAATRRAGS